MAGGGKRVRIGDAGIGGLAAGGPRAHCYAM